MLVEEDGPFDLFFKIRSRFKEGFFFDRLFGCVWCLSVWVGAFLVFGAIINKTLTGWIALPFALSAVAIFITEYIDGEG